jgi:CHASE1-domain containing sensor protein
LNIFKEKLNEARLMPESKKNPNWKRDHFVPQRIPFAGKKYKLVFWFKNGTDNHLLQNSKLMSVKNYEKQNKIPN